MAALKHIKQAASPTTYACDYTTLVAKVALIGVTNTYAYDPFGSRIMQATASSTTWYPNKFVSITNATSSANATSTDYVYAGGTLFETLDQPLINGVATGSPITRYIHTDNLGSTNITSDPNQNRAQWFDYAPYGSVIASTNTGTTTDARQYIGQYSDADGLSYLNARYYNGTQGQFTSEDPVFWGQQNLQDPQSINAYSYSENNPITYEDTTGLSSAYFAADSIGNAINWASINSPQDFGGLMGGEHNYVYFNINDSSGLSELSIPGIHAKNGEANFTLSFEPSNAQSPQGSYLGMQVNNIADATDASVYGGSKGHQDIGSSDYAALANGMYVTGSEITKQKNMYSFWPGVVGKGYNSNSGMFTVANQNGQSAAYNQLQKEPVPVV